MEEKGYDKDLLGVQMLVCQDNYDWVPDVVKFAADMGVGYIQIRPIELRGTLKSVDGVTVDSGQQRYSDKYDGYNPKAALGVMFDPKNNETTLMGDRWKKVKDQKDLIEMTKWIYSNTQYEPWLNEILGPNGIFYGYLYYSYGFVTLKVVDDKTMYVLNLEGPIEEGDGEPHN